MAGVFGTRVSLGQGNGPDIELIVEGDEWYANYETPSGYSAVYDEDAGLFCYARLRAGRFESTGVPVTEPPPAGLEPHARESDDIRMSKVAERQAVRDLQRRREEP
jgi:hypothetical protein